MLRKTSHLLSSSSYLLTSSRRLFSNAQRPQSNSQNALIKVPHQTAQQSSKNNFNYKWALTAVGSFSLGYFLLNQNTQRTGEPSSIATYLSNKKKQHERWVKFNTLLNDIKNAENDKSLEIVLFKKDNNTVITDFYRLYDIFKEIFGGKKISSSNREYFFAYFADSVKKHVTTYAQLNHLININDCSEFITYAQFTHRINNNNCSEFMSHELTAILPKETLKELILDKSTPTLAYDRIFHLAQRSTNHASLTSFKGILNNFSDTELRSIFNTATSLKRCMTFLEHERYSWHTDEGAMYFCRRLGRNHIEELLQNLPPLQQKELKESLPSMNKLFGDTPTASPRPGLTARLDSED